MAVSRARPLLCALTCTTTHPTFVSTPTRHFGGSFATVRLGAGGALMEVTVFKSATVVRATSADTVVIALFNGAPVPDCVALLECGVESARALCEAVGSALETPDRAV